jgi:hypothetical protein
MYATFVRGFDKATAPCDRGGLRAVLRLCLLYPGFCLTPEENLSQGNRKALGCSALKAVYLVDLAIEGDGLDWPAGPCHPLLSRQATGVNPPSRICRFAVLGVPHVS